jgi:hypothetical protein
LALELAAEAIDHLRPDFPQAVTTQSRDDVSVEEAGVVALRARFEVRDHVKPEPVLGQLGDRPARPVGLGKFPELASPEHLPLEGLGVGLQQEPAGPSH